MSEMSKRPYTSYSSFRNSFHSQDCRMLVIGKAGNGKSSVCNTILGRDEFQTGCSLSCTTTRAETADTIINTSCIRVVDTPDVTNCDLSVVQMKDEVSRWHTLVSPEPTAVLLTVRCDVRYTAEEYAIYRQIKDLLGDEFLRNRLILAFTFGDRLDRDITEELKTVCPELKRVLKEAGNRYIVFNNTGSLRLKEHQREQLMKMIDSMATNSKSTVQPICGPLMLVILVLLTFGCIVFLIQKNSGAAVTCGVLLVGGAIVFTIIAVKNNYCDSQSLIK